MNPVTTKEIRRTDDHELVGVLLGSGEGWVPATVFGGALAPATSLQAAEEIVRAEGLSALAESWWLRDIGGSWEEIWFLEVHPDRVRVNDRNPNYGTDMARWVTIDQVELRRRRPPDSS